MHRLEKDNIKEVIIGLKFSESVFPIEQIDRIAVSIYSDWTVKQTFNINVTDKAMSMPFVQKERHGVSIHKDTSVIFLEKDRIAFSKGAPYYENGGDELIKIFKSIIARFENVDYSKTVDFGLRYVNCISISLDRLKEDDYRFFDFPNISCEGLVRNEDYRRIQLLDDKQSMFRVVNVRIKENGNNSVEIILDIDVHLKNTQIMINSSIEESFSLLRLEKNRIFENVFHNVNNMKEFKNG